MNLIIIKPDELSAESCVVLRDDRARHISKVLRAGVGKKLRVGMLNGSFGIGIITSIEPGCVALSCQFELELPPRPQIDLLLAMPRPKVMKRLWAQIAALGVRRIVLLRAEKVEKFYFSSHVLSSEYYTKQLIEGLQQARCTWMPEVVIEPLFKPFIEDRLAEWGKDADKILADPSGELRMGEVLSRSERSRKILAVGPEGGWSPFELQHFQKQGFEMFRMGSRILRSDTATIALLSMMNENLGL